MTYESVSLDELFAEVFEHLFDLVSRLSAHLHCNVCAYALRVFGQFGLADLLPFNVIRFVSYQGDHDIRRVYLILHPIVPVMGLLNALCVCNIVY